MHNLFRQPYNFSNSLSNILKKHFKIISRQVFLLSGKCRLFRTCLFIGFLLLWDRSIVDDTPFRLTNRTISPSISEKVRNHIEVLYFLVKLLKNHNEEKWQIKTLHGLPYMINKRL